MLLSIISIIVVAIVASVIAAVVTSKVCAARFNVVARPEVVTPSDEVVVPSVGKVKTVTLETTNETKVADVVPMSPKTKRTTKATKSETIVEVAESGENKVLTMSLDGLTTKTAYDKAWRIARKHNLDGKAHGKAASAAVTLGKAIYEFGNVTIETKATKRTKSENKPVVETIVEEPKPETKVETIEEPKAIETKVEEKKSTKRTKATTTNVISLEGLTSKQAYDKAWRKAKVMCLNGKVEGSNAAQAVKDGKKEYIVGGAVVADNKAPETKVETPKATETKETKPSEDKQTKVDNEPKAKVNNALKMQVSKVVKAIEGCKNAKELSVLVAKVNTYKNGVDIMSAKEFNEAYEAKTATFKPAETKQKPNQADSKNNRRMENLKKQHEAAKAKAKNNEPKSVEELNAKEEAEKQAAKVASAIAAIEKCETVEEYLKVVNGLGEKMYHNQEVANIRDAWNNDYIERQKAIKAIKDAKTLDEYHAIVDVLSSEQRGRNDMEAARTDWENRFYAENEKNDAKKSGKKNNKPATTPVNSEDATYANNVKSTFVTKVYAMMVKNANCQKVTLKKSEVEYSKNGKNLKVESIARIPENDTDLVITFKDGEKSKGWNVTALNGTSKELKSVLDKVSAAVKKELTA